MSITGTEIKKEVVIKDNKGNVIATIYTDQFPLILERDNERIKEVVYSRKGRVTCV